MPYIRANLIERSVEFFSLRTVNGDFSVSGAPNMDCSWFDENLFQKAVRGSYLCVGNHTKPLQPLRPSTTVLANPETSTQSGQGGSSRIAIGVGVSLGVVFAAAIAAGIYMYLRRRRSTQTRLETSPGNDMAQPAELNDETVKPRELVAETPPREISTSNQPAELAP